MSEFLPPREVVPLLLMIVATGSAMLWYFAESDRPDWVGRNRPPPPAHMPPRFVTPWGIATLFLIISIAGALGAYDIRPAARSSAALNPAITASAE